LNRSLTVLPLALTAVSLTAGCGSDSPTQSPVEPVAAVVATPVPTATTGPTAAPAASTDCPNGQTAVATFEIRVFSVMNKLGEMRPYEVGGVIYVGEVVRFDSQGKDRFRQKTDGCHPDGTRWDWSPDEVMMLNSDKGWNPKGFALSPGNITIVGNLDHVPSAPLVLRVVEAPAQ
jgi:hypothetical protein